MERNETISIIESLIFSSVRPVSIKELATWTSTTDLEVASCLDDIKQAYETENRGIRLVEVAEGFQFRTPKKNSPWIQQTLPTRPIKLTTSNLEVLAIVAYKQPVTRSEIEAIRGVDSSHILKTLLEKNLVQMDGKTDDPGRPILYSTTEQFLQFFSLRNIRELPTLKDLGDLTAFGEQEKVTSESEIDTTLSDEIEKDTNPERDPESNPPTTAEAM